MSCLVVPVPVWLCLHGFSPPLLAHCVQSLNTVCTQNLCYARIFIFILLWRLAHSLILRFPIFIIEIWQQCMFLIVDSWVGSEQSHIYGRLFTCIFRLYSSLKHTNTTRCWRWNCHVCASMTILTSCCTVNTKMRSPVCPRPNSMGFRRLDRE